PGASARRDTAGRETYARPPGRTGGAAGPAGRRPPEGRAPRARPRQPPRARPPRGAHIPADARLRRRRAARPYGPVELAHRRGHAGRPARRPGRARPRDRLVQHRALPEALTSRRYLRLHPPEGGVPGTFYAVSERERRTPL